MNNNKISCGCKENNLGKIEELQKDFTDEKSLYNLADFFKVLGDLTRVKILYVISKSEICVCDIAKTLNMTQSAISHQLRVLKQSKLVKSRRVGKTIFYSLDDDHIIDVFNKGLEHVKE